MLCLYTCTPGLICALLLGASEAEKKFYELLMHFKVAVNKNTETIKKS